jgi:hypothetical protein
VTSDGLIQALQIRTCALATTYDLKIKFTWVQIRAECCNAERFIYRFPQKAAFCRMQKGQPPAYPIKAVVPKEKDKRDTLYESLRQKRGQWPVAVDMQLKSAL